MRGRDREGNGATRELRNKATQTIITHAKVTENYDRDACSKVSIRVGDAAIWKQRGTATTPTNIFCP
jgi:hypothetical protein